MTSINLTSCKGTGFAAGGSTFRPHLGRVIRDLFCLLHATWHGTEALVYRGYTREGAASTCLAIIVGGIASDVPWFLRSTALPACEYWCWPW